LAEFHEHWLELDKVDSAQRSRVAYPDFNAATRAAMREEFVDFVDYVYRRGQGDLAMLYTANFLFPRGPLVALEGASQESTGEPVVLPAGQRSGLLTLPAFMAGHAHANQSSPVLRGKAIRERFFCQPLLDPPPGLVVRIPEVAAGLTTRERFAQHREDPSCAFCHNRIDDLGFALEHYDAVGAYRSVDNGLPIDASGTLSGTDVDGPFDDAPALAAKMAQSEVASRCFASTWFQYASRRPPSVDDDETLETMLAVLSEPAGLHAMLAALAASDVVTTVRIPDPDPTPLAPLEGRP
jgi:Protein of unknown function (DUF1588)/Protein of unknown function (DUF1592)/Protein of unknown function (DUF1585)